MTDADRIDQYRVAADLCEEGGFPAAAARLRTAAAEDEAVLDLAAMREAGRRASSTHDGTFPLRPWMTEAQQRWAKMLERADAEPVTAGVNLAVGQWTTRRRDGRFYPTDYVREVPEAVVMRNLIAGEDAELRGGRLG